MRRSGLLKCVARTVEELALVAMIGEGEAQCLGGKQKTAAWLRKRAS